MKIKFNQDGLIPAIVQEADTGKVLMLAYQNREALAKTLETGYTWFYSRSRQELWNKGATSGHYQQVRDIYYDCDGDTILLQVDQIGNACHKDFHSCFHNHITPTGVETVDNGKLGDGDQLGRILEELAQVIKERKEELPDGSYTTYLFTKGLDKILKKVGEEAAEVIIGAKNNNPEELIYETSDLIYHLLVLLAEQNIELSSIARELAKRRK